MLCDNSQNANDELLPEYRFDYEKAKPNRFASLHNKTTVVLDEDVAQVFTNSESVNKALRKLIEAMPEKTRD
jgi:hypothetical protein